MAGGTTKWSRSEESLEKKRRKGRSLNVLQDALTLQHRKEIIDFTIERRLPGMFVARESVGAGGLMSYGENLAEMYRRGASWTRS